MLYNDETEGKEFKKSMCKGNTKEKITENFRKYNLLHKITITKGIFEDTLYQNFGDQKFSLIFIDCDFYKSTKFALTFALKHISTDGIIALHDYSPEFGIGAKRAAGETLKNNPNLHYKQLLNTSILTIHLQHQRDMEI